MPGCKKDAEHAKAGEVLSPALSSNTTPAEIPETEALQRQPSAEESTKLLSVHTIPAYPQDILPDMVAVTGMDMTVRLSARMKNDPSWVSSFPSLFKAASDCMAHVEDGVSYIAGIPDHTPPEIRIIMVGVDGYWHECLINQDGGPVIALKEIESYSESGPSFFPAIEGRPKINNPQCVALEPVVTRPQGLVGWLGFNIPDCKLPVPD